MKKTLTVLLATTAATVAIGLPALSAIQAPADEGLRTVATISDERPQEMPVVLASRSDDDDNDDARRWRDGSRRGHGDDDDDDDDCEDDDGNCRSGGRGPAAAGAVAPPRNGLFGNGAPPKVQVK